MDIEQSPARVALDDARASVRDGNFAHALDRYGWFFEHALAEDSYLAGVRLSYCLGEWADMAKDYAPALAALHQKKSHARQSFTETGNTCAFHDFISICEVLKCNGEAVKLFKDTHLLNPELAKKVVSLIWAELVTTRQWEICGNYLPHWEARYASALKTFDIAMTEDDLPSPLPPGALKAEERDEFVRRVGNMLLVLKNTDRAGEVEALLRRVNEDMAARGWTPLAHQAAGMLDT